MKETKNELKEMDFTQEEIKEIMQRCKDEEDFIIDADNGEYRFIDSAHIDEIQKEELSQDTYILGCFTPWFISDITGLELEDVEKAQKNESMELLGALMLKEIDKVQEQYSSLDGYGHHFSHYDHSEELLSNGYYVFRTN